MREIQRFDGGTMTVDPTAPSTYRAELCDRLRMRIPEVQDAIAAKLIASSLGSSVQGEADLERGQRESVRACIDLTLLAIEHDADWTEVPVPVAAVMQVQRVARLGLSLQAVLSRYIDGYDVLWDFALEEIEAAELSEIDRAALLHTASRRLALVVGKVLPLVAATHAETASVGAQSRRGRTTAIVEALLSAAKVSTDELDYDVDAAHIGIVATGARAESVVRRLVAADGRPSLVVPRADGTVWAWLQAGQTSDLALAAIDRSFTEGVRLAIGVEGSGRSGFRATHRQAQAAMQVALCQRNFITRYADVLLLVPAVTDRDCGDSLISIYLSPLEESRERNPSLKETLRAYFEAELNTSATAARLNVDRHTAKTRLREIEERLGWVIHVRHAELEVALRLDELRQQEQLDGPGEAARAALDL